MRKPSKKVAIVAGAVGIGLAAFEIFRCEAGRGRAWLGWARLGNARQGFFPLTRRRSGGGEWGRKQPSHDLGMAWHGGARQGLAGHGAARRSSAAQGKVTASERSAEVAHLLWEQVGAGSIPAAPTMIFTGP